MEKRADTADISVLFLFAKTFNHLCYISRFFHLWLSLCLSVCSSDKKRSNEQLVRNVFIANLAVSDLCLCIVTMPLTLIEVNINNAIIMIMIEQWSGSLSALALGGQLCALPSSLTPAGQLHCHHHSILIIIIITSSSSSS